MGAAGGVLEDYVTRQAYQHTVAEGRNVAVPLWTARSMLPAVMFYVNPLLCRKCLDGEQKGTDVAMAFMNGHALQQWPFFSVDLPVDVPVEFQLCFRSGRASGRASQNPHGVPVDVPEDQNDSKSSKFPPGS